MKLSELMTGVTPNAEFEGIVTAGDMVLAVDFSGSASSPADYIVADGGAGGHHRREHLPAQRHHRDQDRHQAHLYGGG